ncbi:MAG: diaminopimelate epimerase [Gemmatimonadota bacterium]
MNRNPRLGSKFFKGHGHGNDYLVFEEGDFWSVTSEAVRTICHRQRGVGSDGIVALLSSRSPFRVRMYNPDGSEFERSGNGLRILAAYLHLTGRAKIGAGFRVEVGGDEVTIEILGEGKGGIQDVSVEMGKARFGPRAVGADPDSFSSGAPAAQAVSGNQGSVLRGPDGATLEVHPVSLGNPHCVLFRKEPLEADFQELGPFLTGHPSFPNGANVQIARVVSPEEVEILIWERGVGRTSSSGTSACAAAAAGVQAGLLAPGPIRVEMEGGSFTVKVTPQMSVTLRGPVEPLYFGELTEGLLSRLRS